jgi:hypothetical protein
MTCWAAVSTSVPSRYWVSTNRQSIPDCRVCRARAARNGQSTCHDRGAPRHRKDVYFRAADFFGGAVLSWGARRGSGGLRASLTALPALACMGPHCLPGCDFDGLSGLGIPSLACRPRRHVESAESGDTDRLAGHEGIKNGVYRGLNRLVLAQLPERFSRSVRLGSSPCPDSSSAVMTPRFQHKPA